MRTTCGYPVYQYEQEAPEVTTGGPVALLNRNYRFGTLIIWLAMFMGFLHLY